MSSAEARNAASPASDRVRVLQVARGAARQQAWHDWQACMARANVRAVVHHITLAAPADARALAASLAAATPTPGGAPLGEASIAPRLQRAFDAPGALVCIEIENGTGTNAPDVACLVAWFTPILAALHHASFLVLVDPPAPSSDVERLPADVELLLAALVPAPLPLTSHTWTAWLPNVWRELARDPSDAAAQARAVPELPARTLDAVERAWDRGDLVEGLTLPGEGARGPTFTRVATPCTESSPAARAVLRAAFRCAAQRIAQRAEELESPVDGAEVVRLAALAASLGDTPDCDATTRMLAIALRAMHGFIAPTGHPNAGDLIDAFAAAWSPGSPPPRGSAFAALELVRLAERQKDEAGARQVLQVLDQRAIAPESLPGDGAERESLRMAVAGVRVTLALGELRKSRARIAALRERRGRADRMTRAWIGTLDAMLGLVDDDRGRAAQHLMLALADLRALGGRRAALDATLAASVLAERAGACRVSLDLLRAAMPDVATLGDPWVRAHVALHAAWRHIASASSASPGDAWLRDAHVASRLTGSESLRAWVQTIDELESRVFPDDDALRVVDEPLPPPTPRPTVADLFLHLGGTDAGHDAAVDPSWTASPWARLAARRAMREIDPAARLAQAPGVPALRDDDLVVLGAAHLLRLPGGAWVDLTGAPLLARLLEPLLDAHRSARGTPVSADALIETLWGASDEHEVLLNRLHQTVSRLRRVGLRDLVLTGAGGYCLRPNASVIRVDDP